MKVYRFNAIGKKQMRVISFCLFLFAFLLYANTIGHSYNMDDNLVTINHRLTSKGITAIPEIFTSPYYQDDQGYAYEYRPVVLTSFAIEHSLFGESPQVSHFINVLLYAFTGLILFLLLQQLFPDLNTLLSLSVALLFVVHPIHTEVVANIKNRDEILSLMFGMAAFYCALKFVRESKWKYSIPISVLYLAGLLSKMSIVPFVLIIPFGLVFFLKPSFKQLITVQLPLILIAMFFIPFNDYYQRGVFAMLVFSLPLVLFVYNDNSVRQNLAVFFSRIYKWIEPELSFKLLDKIMDVSFFRGGVVPDYFFPGFKIIRGISFSILIASIVIFALAFLNKNFFLPVSLVAILTILFWLSDRTVRVLSFILILAFVSIISIRLISYTAVLYIFIPLVLGLITKHKATRIFYFVMLALIIPVIYLTEGDYNIILSLITIASVYLYSKGKIGRKVFMTILVIFGIYALVIFVELIEISGPFSMLINPLSFFIILLLSYYKVKPIVISNLLFYLIPFVFLYMVVSHKPPPDPPVTQINKETKIKKKNTGNALFLSPQLFFSTDRPLSFDEVPLANDAPLNERIGTSAYVLGEYLRLMFFPHLMGFYYGYAYIVPVGLDNPQAIVSLLLHTILLLTALVLIFIRKHSVVSFGILFYLISISVFSNFVFPVVGMMADRFSFVASLGICIVLAYLFLKLFKTSLSKDSFFKVKSGFVFLMVFVLGVASIKTFARNSLWKDRITLMQHDISHLDKSAKAHYLLAGAYISEYFENNSGNKQKQINEAVRHFKKATEIYPEFFNAQFDLGRAYREAGDLKNAVIAFNKVLEIDSSFPTPALYIADIYQSNGMTEEAIPYYYKYIRNANDPLQSYFNLINALGSLGRMEEAIDLNKSALKRYPQSIDLLMNLGEVYLAGQDTTHALESMENAHRLSNDPNIAYYISNVYRSKGDIKMSNYYRNLSGAN